MKDRTTLSTRRLVEARILVFSVKIRKRNALKFAAMKIPVKASTWMVERACLESVVTSLRLKKGRIQLLMKVKRYK